MSQQACTLQTDIVQTYTLNYLLHIPNDVHKQTKWPLILFLHGMGQRGDDLQKIKKHGLPAMLDEKEDFPSIVISPQCPEHSFWFAELNALNALLDHCLEQYPVDPSRVYVTGLSMGGYGTWHLATAYPERFAAIAPICGGGIPSKAERLQRIPTWVFHGAKDDVVPIIESEQMVNALRECGGDVRFTVYPEANHDSWSETYANPELYEWLFSHRNQTTIAPEPAQSLSNHVIGDLLDEFTHQKALAEWAIDQVSEDDLHTAPAPGLNSIAILMKHICGNIRSRLTDFLHADGEKADRDREAEFTAGSESKADLMHMWEEAWELVMNTVMDLKEGDVLRKVTIRGTERTVIQALQRQLTHYSYHIGQIVYVARIVCGEQYNTKPLP